MKFIFFYKLKFKYYLKPYICSLKKELQREKKFLMSGIHYCQKLKNTIKI